MEKDNNLGKIKIGGELNPIYGRIGSAAHIYDYANNKTQERINTMLLNEMYSFDLGLNITSIIEGAEGRTNIAEYKGGTVNAWINWNITRKHGFSFVLDNITCPDGIYLSIDNTFESTMSELTSEQLWAETSRTQLKAGKGVTTATMGMDMEEGFSVEQTASFYHLPPIYFGFSDLDEVANPSLVFEDSKTVSMTPSGRYKMINELGTPAYFYICIPHTIGVDEIEVYSSGFQVPFVKVLSENTSDTGLDKYDCWRNPTGSMILNGSEIVYDVK